MSHNFQHNVLPIEKIISAFSYITMGIVGFLWIIIAHLMKKRLKYFLMYNIVQSMFIAIFLAIFKLIIDIFLSIISLIPFIDFVAAIINILISFKILTIPFLHMSFTIIELFIYSLLIYLIWGISIGRIFYVPFLTGIMQKVMKSYN